MKLFWEQFFCPQCGRTLARSACVRVRIGLFQNRYHCNACAAAVENTRILLVILGFGLLAWGLAVSEPILGIMGAGILGFGLFRYIRQCRRAAQPMADVRSLLAKEVDTGPVAVEDPPAPPPPPAIAKSIWIALAWCLTDAFFFDQGVIALVILVFVTPVRLFQALKKRAEHSWRNHYLQRAGIYALAGLLALGVIRANRQMAERRARELVAACESYQARHGRFPDRLTALVPDFIPAVPRAKYTLGMGAQFQYFTTPDSHRLVYVVVPPFGRQHYHFETRKWGYLD